MFQKWSWLLLESQNIVINDGVDMMWDVEDQLFNKGLIGWLTGALTPAPSFFNTADKLWNEVMDNAVDFINENGGKAEKTHNFSRIIDWDDVKEKDKL